MFNPLLIGFALWLSNKSEISSLLQKKQKAMEMEMELKLHVKVVINKEKTKVLFAEADSNFADVLLSFLLLPLGTIVRVLEKHYRRKAPVIGSLTTLYKGATNLNFIYFEGEHAKNHIISSTHFETEFCKLGLNICGTHPTSSSSGKSNDGVFIKSTARCIISDDLRVLPIVTGSIIETLSSLGIAVEDMDGTETRNVASGLNEVIHHTFYLSLK